MSDINQAPELAAAEMGLEVVRPQKGQLLIDLDTEEDREVFKRHLEILRREMVLAGGNVRLDRFTRSKSGNWHAYLTLLQEGEPREITEVERIALQAALGSDRTRELLGVFRAWRGIREPSVLFELPFAEATKAD